MKDYFPKSSAQQIPWLTNFKTKIAIHGTTLGLTKEEIATYQGYCDNTVEKINAVEAKKSELKAAVKSKNESLQSKPESLRTKIAHFKTATGYVKSIGEELGVVSTTTVMDKSSYKAAITAQLFAGFVRIKFVKSGVDGVNIYRRRKGDTAWKFLARNSKSPYDDHIILTNVGQPEHFEYRAYGIVSDNEIGIASDIVDIVFGG
jgi:hypothetical protein